MAKTLVVKGANFSINKVTTVTFDSVPCTGITFSSDTITINGTEQVEIEYEIAPVDTTDSVIWTSSNTNIVSVEEGVIIPVGIGSCTVTATCGSYSATATVTVSMSYTSAWGFGYLSIQGAENRVQITNNYSRIYAGGSDAQATEHKMFVSTDENSVPAVKLPGNTGSIKIRITNANIFYTGSNAYVLWAKDESAGYLGHPIIIKGVSIESAYDIRNNMEKTFSIPEGVNALSFHVRTNNTYTSSDNANTIAQSGGLTIEFLPVTA